MDEFKKLLPVYADYYESHFPFDQIYRWFSYGGSVNPVQREWSFEALTPEAESFVGRFRVFHSAKNLRQFATQGDPLPLKFDIGPIYSSDISLRAYTKIVPVYKEFVFDIDSNDYQTVRHCCEGAYMCPKCWRFMECAECILVLFCKTFGFQNYLFAYSGRRGMHCWICDEAARDMEYQARLNMLRMFNLIINDGDNLEMLAFEHLYIDLVFRICEIFFTAMYEEQEWGVRGDLDAFIIKLNHMKGKNVFPKVGTSVMTAAELKGKVKPELWRHICIYFTYPRFDIQVTKSLVHLLKVPFSVHRGTLWVAVPMNPQYVLEEYKIDFLSVHRYEHLRYRYYFEQPCKVGEDISEYVAFLKEFLDRFV